MTIKENGNEGENFWTRSHMHNFQQISETEQPKNLLTFTLQVDWQFKLSHVKGPNSNETQGTEYVIHSSWRSNWESHRVITLSPSVSSGDSRYADVVDEDNIRSRAPELVNIALGNLPNRSADMYSVGVN